MDAAGAGSSSKPTPTRPRLAVRVRGRPSSILSRADPAEWRSRPAVSWTVENNYEDFSGRRRALVGALTKGKERMCLFGYPDGKWSLTLPEKMLPLGLPEPKLGINRRPEYMNRYDYLSFIARHSDSWLMGVALFLTTLLNAKQKYVTTKLLLLLLLPLLLPLKTFLL
ncbi:PHD finger protein ALFIN-LIKE 2-like [Hordeum vulgare subsp. vulgare]|uniref:PHD finger protein ALFIN-LIKE 2-like n=1 Tax=Hordeum vulgare subsp. vulgare TaxID=112509 RepID=UPI001D1A44BC|nr:PHD finger protein ALFIN-LIKE 2-like [Hordeum vulgare subsp. vulgare]